MNFKNAFTLAEVLIALTLLGIVAVFAIPKVMQSAHEAEKKAVFKETLATVSQVLHTGVLKQDMVHLTSDPSNYLDVPQFQQYFVSKLNAAKACPTNVDTEGCYSRPGDPSPGAGALFSNGAVIKDIDGWCFYRPDNKYYCTDYVQIDWNGSKPPNKWGDDLLGIVISFGEASNGIAPGGIAVRTDLSDPQTNAANKALWTEIFSGS